MIAKTKSFVMEARKFRPGNRVRRKRGGPPMEVVRYAVDYQALADDSHSEHDVVCVWYDEEHERHKEIFDQRALYKLEEDHGLFSMKD